MRQKSPQEKKALSYAKDRRNNYGENDKASRKNIPLRKANVNRSYRRKVNEILIETDSSNPEQFEIIDTEAKNIQREFWKKCADEPLGSFLKRKLDRRESHAGNGKSARKRATEFVKNLKFDIKQDDDGRWIAEAVGMNGVLRYGETHKDAIAKCKQLARIVFLEQIDAVDQVHIAQDVTSYRSK